MLPWTLFLVSNLSLFIVLALSSTIFQQNTLITDSHFTAPLRFPPTPPPALWVLRGRHMFTFTISLVSDVTQSDDTHKMALLWSKVWTITAGRPLTTGLSHPPHAMTSLNGIWPAECLGSVWGWCQSKSKQVLQSAALTTSLNSKTFLQGTTHLSQWESREMIRLELTCKHVSGRGC